VALARLESNGSTGRNRQLHSICRRTIELERLIDFEEMKMASDLDGSVTGVGDAQFGGRALLKAGP